MRKDNKGSYAMKIAIISDTHSLLRSEVSGYRFYIVHNIKHIREDLSGIYTKTFKGERIYGV